MEIAAEQTNSRMKGKRTDLPCHIGERTFLLLFSEPRRSWHVMAFACGDV